LKRALTICALVITTATLAFSSYSIAAEIYYRWTDDRGRPVHSDRPPPKGVNYEVISTGSKFVRPVDAKEGAVPLAIEPTVRNNFKKVDPNQPEIIKNPEYCKRGRDNLAALNTNARVRVRNDKGEIHYIDEEEHASQTRIAIDTIAIHCE
jgi:hypothetical protein